jgi:hypothetical protein
VAEGTIKLSSFMDRTLVASAEPPRSWRDALLEVDQR